MIKIVKSESNVTLRVGPHPVTIPAENVGPYVEKYGLGTATGQRPGSHVTLHIGPHPVTIPAENVGPYLRRYGYTMGND